MKLPKTADGVEFEIGMPLYSTTRRGSVFTNIFETMFSGVVEQELVLSVSILKTDGMSPIFIDGYWYLGKGENDVIKIIAQIDELYSLKSELIDAEIVKKASQKMQQCEIIDQEIIALEKQRAYCSKEEEQG